MKRKKLGGTIIIAVFAVLFVAVVRNTASLKRQDTLKFIKEDTTPAHTQRASYEVNIGKTVGGATVVSELWQNGVCTKSTPFEFSSQANQLHITLLIDGFGRNEGVRGLNVQIDTDEKADAGLSYFELPSQVTGYTFTAYDDQETMTVHAGEEKVLAAMAFDMGAGIRSMDCTSLLNEPQRFMSAPCLLIVRTAFTAV